MYVVYSIHDRTVSLNLKKVWAEDYGCVLGLNSGAPAGES